MSAHTPANPAHSYLITMKDGVESGRCRICGATRVYGEDQRRNKAFGNEPLKRIKPMSVFVKEKRS